LFGKKKETADFWWDYTDYSGTTQIIGGLHRLLEDYTDCGGITQIIGGLHRLSEDYID
jgi:hypothetical protein